MQRILFANMGWMAHYEGITDNDMIVGGGSHDPNDKHEVYNFQNLDGKCYGYVQNSKNNLSRIDDSQNCTEFIDDVLVVWTATNDQFGGRYIVGWYKNARVFANYQKIKNSRRKNYRFNIIADAKDCTLVPADSRVMNIPRGTGFMGQSLVWYADGNTANCTPTDKSRITHYKNEVISYIQNYSKTAHKKNVLKVNADAKAKVERIAIEYVAKHYQSLGFTINDVQKDNLGWDLEAKKGKSTLKIEVKGLSGNTIDVLLSKNEYEKMLLAENKEIYRLCVVTNALTTPELTTFLRYSKNWVAEDDPTMILQFSARTIEATLKD